MSLCALRNVHPSHFPSNEKSIVSKHQLMEIFSRVSISHRITSKWGRATNARDEEEGKGHMHFCNCRLSLRLNNYACIDEQIEITTWRYGDMMHRGIQVAWRFKFIKPFTGWRCTLAHSGGDGVERVNSTWILKFIMKISDLRYIECINAVCNFVPFSFSLDEFEVLCITCIQQLSFDWMHLISRHPWFQWLNSLVSNNCEILWRICRQ